MPATKTFLEGMTNLALKKLKKLKKQADRDVAKEEKLSEKKFHPNESAEMDDLAEARYKANSIADELYKVEEKIKKSGKLIPVILLIVSIILLSSGFKP